MRHLDFSAFSIPYDAAAGQTLAARLYATGPTRRKFVGMGVAVDVIGSIAFGAMLLVFLPLTISAIVGVFTTGFGRQGVGSGLGLLATLIVVTLFSAGFLWFLLHRYFIKTGSPQQWWRLDRFAAANGLTFAPWSPVPEYPSALFTAGATTAAYSHVYSDDGDDFVDLGNLYYQSGRKLMESVDHHWGFMAVRLDRSLDHMLLDAKSNNFMGIRGLPITTWGSVELDLGAYADRFTLYAQSGSAPDAKLVFTPTVLDALLAAGDLDVEVNDRWLFVFSRKRFDMTDAALVERMFTLAGVLQAITL